MPLELCPICARMHFHTDPCRQKPSLESLLVGVTPQQEIITNSVGREFPAPEHDDPAQAANPLERIISKANGPDDTQQPVRSNAPKPVNRNEYHKLNMRKWRAAKKAQGVNT